jgi:alpha-glucuronidase
MEKYLKQWSKDRIIPKINKVKQIFVEQRQRLEHNQETEDFIRAHKEGAVMMAVINGKFSGIIICLLFLHYFY